MSSDLPSARFVSSSLRPGNPDLLDLPWDVPLSAWAGRTPHLERLPAGPSRHPVVFVSYAGQLFALKELPPDMAEKEHGLLRRMQDLRLPVVQPVGHVRTRTDAGEASVLVTRYLDRSLPYYLLFQRGSLSRYRDHLLDAMASLLVQLHLAGAYWGDCSLFNTLFRRDAGALQAYLVDAETSEVHPTISPGMRRRDVEIMEENVCGALADLQAAGVLPPGAPVLETGTYLRQRYEDLWDEITREEVLDVGERYRIEERVRALNTLGFSVDEVELCPTDSGRQLHLRTVVTDRTFHRNVLQTLTGLDAEEKQARHIVNEIQQLKATLSAERNRSVPLSVAAYHWQREVYQPAIERLAAANAAAAADPTEIYFELLEHKWYLSERAQRDVGHQAAMDDYVQARVAPRGPPSWEGALAPLADGSVLPQADDNVLPQADDSVLPQADGEERA